MLSGRVVLTGLPKWYPFWLQPTGISGTGSPLWPGFLSGSQFGSVSITVPLPGQDLDEIAFVIYDNIRVNAGRITIYAPSGTLSTSTQLPATLDAFEQYALANPGGEFAYSAGSIIGQDIGVWGVASGTLGTLSAVPEPTRTNAFFHCCSCFNLREWRYRPGSTMGRESLCETQPVDEILTIAEMTHEKRT
jgi:hypothetical protein